MIVSLIAGTTTRKGWKVHAEVNDQRYPPGIKVSDAEIEKINLRREALHGEWSYEILPRL